MNFRIKSFSTVRIFVTNVRESRDWYKSFFNQDPVEEIDNFVSFNINGTCFDIALADAKNPYSYGGCVGYWLVDNLDSLLARVERLNAKVYRGPMRVPEIQRTILQIQDPFGNLIGFEAPF
jgi:predicted enzyme related to lactoylglutathione lyase